MSRAWRAGDVAAHEGTGEVAIRHLPERDDQRFSWTGVGRDGRSFRATDDFGPMRRLVVIDPEDRDQAERLYVAIFRAFDNDDLAGISEEDARLMQAALREFANPAPPKPEEPTGLGAVVEDAEGARWVRTYLRYGSGWVTGDEASGYEPYSNITVVRVLSEGVTP